ncbi:hypothetical protein Trydic_g2994 [Trypoxylus dichotomus]
MRNDTNVNSAALKDKGGQTLADRKMIIKRWKDYFEELLNTPSKVTIQQMHGLGNSRDTAGGVLEKGKITEEYLEEVLQRIKNGKAPGDGKINNRDVQKYGVPGKAVIVGYL